MTSPNRPFTPTQSFILHLTDGWALGCDQLQWIVLRAKKRGEETYWNPVAFIATEKRFLLRSLQEKNLQLSPEATKFINAMPDTFREWLHRFDLAKSDPPSDEMQAKPP